MSLAQFHPIIQDWFRSRFEAPTQAQVDGWSAIAQGRHALIAAPTGSGKTLAAFLTCIDQLVRQGLRGGLPDTTQVVYVSPLKALSNDIQKNLATPLDEIHARAEARGTPLPAIKTAVRTGDTPAYERQKMAKQPPHILITTPESLYILLTSESGRRGLTDVKTIILDEIHAVADDKRGAHLSLSVERLCALARNPVVRVGLSATQRPIDEVARFLVGNRNVSGEGVPNCLIVDTGHTRRMELAVQLPQTELGPIATHEVWGETLDTVVDLAANHGTTLVFVNTRRLVERVSHQLSLRMGEPAVVAHHGSLSRSRRLAAEEKLKQGEVKVCVATASLELGIDIGVVDLVCQIGSPRSIGLLLQRVGRSGHTIAGTPKGALFPLTRDELVECAALCRAVRRSNLDALRIPDWPLDVLGQQIVAACAAEEWPEDALFDLCVRAYPYRDLPRDKFNEVVEALAEGFAPRLGRRGAHLHRDGVNRILKGRRGARLAALTSGGAIPDNADYDVIAAPEDVFVGTVNEDFAIESMAGDVFLLGNTPWKIRRVESGKVRVEDAQGLAPTIPFWLGEAPGRTRELSGEITELRAAVDAQLERPDDAEAWLVQECGILADGARQIVEYLAEGKRVLGIVPTGDRVVAERFFDESGGMQLVIHSPFGAAINRAWGMALRKRICRTFDFELQASATDDGLNFSLGPNLSFPLSDVFTYLSPRTVDEVLLQAILQAPVFGTRWRWNATRFLALLRHTGGRKVPAPLQRMRSEDLLAAVFPAQVQCQDNASGVEIDPPDHPLVFETIRDCLTEAMDLNGLKQVLAAIERGEIEVYARDTVQPSVFSHQILNAMPYAFLDDAPLEERRARAVTLRRALPQDARELGQLDAAAIAEEHANAWPPMRDADELHDALLNLGILPESFPTRRRSDPDSSQMTEWFGGLAAAGRAYRLILSDDWHGWVAAERLPVAFAAYPSAKFSPPPNEIANPDPELTTDVATLSIVRGWVDSTGPVTAGELAATLGLDHADVAFALGQLEGEGLVLRGSFRPGAVEEEFCDRRILARIHRATLGRLRREIEPVSQAALMRFLLRWQHLDPATSAVGEGGLLDVIEQLQGFEIPAGVLESEVIAPRTQGYKPELLDGLCLGGEVVWGCIGRQLATANGSGARSPLNRATSITLALRESLDWLLGPAQPDHQNGSGASAEVLSVLSQRGACFISDIVSLTRRLPSDVEEGLWLLAAQGRVTSDSLQPLRRRVNGGSGRPRNGATNGNRSSHHRHIPARRLDPRRRESNSRWSILEPLDPATDVLELRVTQLLRRYGVVFPELLARESTGLNWRDAVRVLRRMEAQGEIRAGRFVTGFVGEQFALPEAVDLLREINRSDPTGNMVVVSACDPLNLTGILTTGSRVPAVPGNRIVFRDGVPVASLEAGNLAIRSAMDEPVAARVHALLQVPQLVQVPA